MAEELNAAGEASTDPIVHVANIVAAYVSKNSLPAAEMPSFIRTVHKAITGLMAGPANVTALPMPEPAVPPKKSITREYLICLEDGKKFVSLRRHLAQLGMSPDEYRVKWGLSKDYPMVAPAYSEKRSTLAKASGLGQIRTAAESTEPVPVEGHRPHRRASVAGVRARRHNVSR